MIVYVQLRADTREGPHPPVKRMALPEPVPRQGEVIDLGQDDTADLWEVMRVIHRLEKEPDSKQPAMQAFYRYRGSDYLSFFHDVVLFVRAVELKYVHYVRERGGQHDG